PVLANPVTRPMPRRWLMRWPRRWTKSLSGAPPEEPRLKPGRLSLGAMTGGCWVSWGLDTAARPAPAVITRAISSAIVLAKIIAITSSRELERPQPGNYPLAPSEPLLVANLARPSEAEMKIRDQAGRDLIVGIDIVGAHDACEHERVVLAVDAHLAVSDQHQIPGRRDLCDDRADVADEGLGCAHVSSSHFRRLIGGVDHARRVDGGVGGKVLLEAEQIGEPCFHGTLIAKGAVGSRAAAQGLVNLNGHDIADAKRFRIGDRIDRNGVERNRTFSLLWRGSGKRFGRLHARLDFRRGHLHVGVQCRELGASAEKQHRERECARSPGDNGVLFRVFHLPPADFASVRCW